MRGIKGNGIMHHKVAIYDAAGVQTGSAILLTIDRLSLWADRELYAVGMEARPRTRTARILTKGKLNR